MKFLTGIAVAAALILLPAAQAQISCAVIDDLIDLGWDDFDDIVGDEIEDGYYDADFWLDDADECFVGLDDFSSTYACLWVFSGESPAASLYDAVAGELGKCLSGWAASAGDTAKSSGELVSLRKLILTEEDDFGDIEWVVTFDRHEAKDETDWHVSLGLSYYW